MRRTRAEYKIRAGNLLTSSFFYNFTKVLGVRGLDRLPQMNLCLFGQSFIHNLLAHRYKHTATPSALLDCHVLGAGINHE